MPVTIFNIFIIISGYLQLKVWVFLIDVMAY